MRIGRRLVAYAPVVLLVLVMLFSAWRARVPAPRLQPTAEPATPAATAEATAQPTSAETSQPTSTAPDSAAAAAASVATTPTPLAPGTALLQRGWQTLHTDLNDLVRLGISLAPTALIVLAFVGFRLIARHRSRRR